MRIIATCPTEHKILHELVEYLFSKGIIPSVTRYEYGFGITVWSVDDLNEIPAARNWTAEERIIFMKIYGRKIGGATADAWEKMSAYVDEYLSKTEGISRLP